MVKGAIPAAIGEESIKIMDLSCTFCGPGTWAIWEVVTDDCVVFTCDRHHAEMSQAKVIRLERMRGNETWNKSPDFRETLYEEEYVDDPTDFEDTNDYA